MPTIAIKPAVKPQIEAGSYIARCYQFIHIGTSRYQYMGQEKVTNKIRFTFELPTEKKVFKEGDEAKPCAISTEFNLTLFEKGKLRPAIEGWLGRKLNDMEADAFDVESLVGKECMLNVIHNEKGYAEIASISPLPKGVECPAQINKSQTLSYDNFDKELFEKLPEFLRKSIQESDEYNKMILGKEGEVDPPQEDVPFPSKFDGGHDSTPQEDKNYEEEVKSHIARKK